MSQDWMKFEKATSDKPEVIRMAGDLGIDQDAVVGKLIRVWGYFDTHTLDGTIKNASLGLIDGLTRTPNFGQAMADVQWLIVKNNDLSMPNFKRHFGRTAKKRAVTARRVNKWRSGNAASVTGSAHSGNADSVTGSAHDVTPEALPEERRGEKSREDKKKKEKEKTHARPTLEEVVDFVRERGNKINPHKWFNHYKANGWKVGKVPMVDWKAAVIGWESNDFNSRGQAISKEEFDRLSQGEPFDA